MEIKLLSGRDINADPRYGITLKDDRQYFAYYSSQSVQLIIDSPLASGPEQITLNAPVAGGKIVILSDPTDPFRYYFASTPVGDWGEGTSKHGLIPFIPASEFSRLDSFYGSDIEKGKMGFGFKFVDFFEVKGMRVIRKPLVGDIDWDHPLQSNFGYRAGINGKLSFSLGVPGNTFFAFDLVDTSGTFNVTPSYGSTAFVLDIAPDVSWVPEWFPLLPSSEAYGELFADSNGEFSIELGANYRSTLPQADLSGTMIIDNGGTHLEASTLNAGETFDVSLVFADGMTTGAIHLPDDYAAELHADILSALDTELSKIDAAYLQLEKATADYALEVSLRGLRQSLPAIADKAVSTLNGIPQLVYDAAYSNALSTINGKCVTVVLVKKCLKDVVDEKAIAKETANTAKGEASDAIVAPKNAMAELKKRALEGDDASLRSALKAALKSAYDHRNFSKKITVKKKFSSPFGTYTLYSKTVNKQVLPAATASRILTAHQNVDRIEETSNTLIEAAAIVDALPVRKAVADVRDEVAAHLADMPSIDGLGYRVNDAGLRTFAMVDSTEYDLQAVNALSPAAARQALGDLVKDLLIDDAE